MFLYVMDSESKDKLVKLGFELLKENSKKTVWIFKNKPEQLFATVGIPCVVSDTLTF